MGKFCQGRSSEISSREEPVKVAPIEIRIEGRVNSPRERNPRSELMPQMPDNRSHLELAVQAAGEVAQTHGLGFQQAIVLQDLSNIIVHLDPTPVVARIATTTGTIRPGKDWFAREVAIARYLATSGAPVIPPSELIDPGPHQHNGFVISFWDFVEKIERPLDGYAAGKALRLCHEVLKEFPGELPVLAAIREADGLFEELNARSVWSPKDAEMLDRVRQDYQNRLDRFPMQPLHGDPHFGNAIDTTRGLLWIDWEDTFIGPVGWDLASLVASARVLGTEVDRASAALNGYGTKIDEEALRLCVRVRTFVALLWGIVIHQQHPSAERQARIEARLQWFRLHNKS